MVGVDWTKHAIELASAAAAQPRLDAKFLVGDVTAWLPEARFDLVISAYAQPGGEGSLRALQTAIEALKPGGTLIVVERDRSKTQVWGFGEDDLMTPQQIAASLPGLVIERAEVRQVQDVFASPDAPRGQAGSSANVAFVRARKP